MFFKVASLQPCCVRIKSIGLQSQQNAKCVQIFVNVFTWLFFETPLTHWGWVTHICVDKLTITGSDNGLSPGRRQVIIWIGAGILLIGALETNFSGILIGIQTFSFKKMYLKMSSAQWRPFCLDVNVLNRHQMILGAYVNKLGKNSFAWRHILQPIGPSYTVLNYA